MANEAIVTIVAKMRDEASPKMKDLAKNTKDTETNAVSTRIALVAMGSAVSMVGSLIGRIDDPMAKLVSDILMFSGAILSSVAAIVHMIPFIKSMIDQLRNLAVAQAIVKAFQGPGGWAALAIGAGVGAGAAALINRATSGGGNEGTLVNKIYLDGNQIGESSRRYSLGKADQNNTSGVK